MSSIILLLDEKLNHMLADKILKDAPNLIENFS